MAVEAEAQTSGRGINAQNKNPSAQPNGTKQEEPSKKPRPRRPNYNLIHAKPLPVDVFPLPAFIPHNPISIVRIAIALLSHTLFPQNSHSSLHKAYFSPQTQSIHVTDPASIRALWEDGFWGKGSLSRSEPQWLAGEKRRKGVEEGQTSAEVTQNRREERRQFKLERARAQREAIERQLRQEGKLDPDGCIEELVKDGQVSESPRGTIYTPDAGDVVIVGGDSVTSAISESLKHESPAWGATETVGSQHAEIKDQEHLQLTPEEAFFLTYTLGILSIVSDGDNHVEIESCQSYPAWYLLRLYAAHANSPVVENNVLHLQNAFQQRERGNSVYPAISCIPFVEPDNSFILRYVVYHHFRSLGWVVRPGIKFAVDYLLYLRGPAFHHAEFAVMILPSYSHSYWTEAPAHESRIEERMEPGKKDWWWLHRVNRVQSAVFKTLVLVYVEIPPPWDIDYMEHGWKINIGGALKKYSVREVVIKRWSPNRNRD